MSKKDYKQGMSDAMEAYEAFGEKQEAATRHVAKQVDKVAGKVDKLGGQIDSIVNYITDQEKAALYRLNTPVDIADLGNQEKKVLVAILYQLAADESEVTEDQQNYIRAIQQYLCIFNPQTEIDLEVVEDIEDIPTQKAVLQAVLEFLYLGTHPKSYTEDQMDFLECFQLNRKTRKEIMANIETMAEAVGKAGIAEKYGFVPEDDDYTELSYTDNGPVSSEVADWCIKQSHLIETTNHYCAVKSTDTEVVFELKHKKTGESHLLNADGNWYVRRTCTYENTVFIFATGGADNRNARRIFVVNAELKAVREIQLDFPADTNMSSFFEGRFVEISADANYLLFFTFYDRRNQFLIDLKHGDRKIKISVPFHIESAVACEGRILMAGNHEETEEIWLYWYDPVKNHTYKATKSPMCATGSSGLLGCYGEDSAVKIVVAHRVGNHLVLILEYDDGSDSRKVLCKYAMASNAESLEIVCKGYIDKSMDFCPALLIEEETDHGTRIRALQNIVRREISDDDDCYEYYDCTTMEELDIVEAEAIHIYGDYLFKKDGKTWCKTNVHSNQLWEVI